MSAAPQTAPQGPTEITPQLALLYHHIQHPPHPDPRSLAQLLLDLGLVLPEQLAPLCSQQDKGEATPATLNELQRKGLLSPEQKARVLALKFGMVMVHLDRLPIDPHISTLIPVETARHYPVMPVALWGDRLILATTDPTDQTMLRQLEFLTNHTIAPVLAASTDIEQAIARYYGSQDVDDVLRTTEAEAESRSNPETSALGYDQPTVRFVSNVLLDAVNSQASDIHFRPGEHEVELLFRLDGVLAPIRRIPRTLYPAVVSRIKIFSGMDISEKRLPQDGRARVEHHGQPVDLRVSVIPCVHGESVVIRLLDRNIGLRALNELGFHPDDETRFRRILSRNNGIVLITGPTGSGKSTTLYAALRALIAEPINIITVEDPVEYRIDGINQIQVNHETGYSFARALRNILRHDPDVIMIGEMRDRETSQIAVESALTGHLVLSSLHTNSAATAVTRLLEMGVEPYLLSTSLLAVVAQRLVRRNCPHCQEPETVEPMVREALHVGPDEVFHKGKGCDHCRQTGYKGRVAVYEMLELTPALRQMIQPGADAWAIEQQAIQDGMQPLTLRALDLARNRQTSLAEVFRVRLA